MNHSLPQALQFRQPVLRHLLWLAQARQLLRGTAVFRPADYFKPEHWKTLTAWDADSSLLPSRLKAEPKRLLGLYVEELYHSLLEDLFGWSVLARNLPVYDDGRTIGEMDFLVRNPVSGAIEHHEIAIKFYLGYADGRGLQWYGPNPADRLDLKTRRMLDHQSQLCAHPAALPALEALGIREPVESRLFMPGYLFYPTDRVLDAPRQADPGHARGWWLFVDQVDAALKQGLVPLDKPHWLGPWFQRDAPDLSLVADALAKIEAGQHPRLFAQLEWDDEYQMWIEQQRYFVVPRSWPKQK